jgi:hypothetical protein
LVGNGDSRKEAQKKLVYQSCSKTQSCISDRIKEHEKIIPFFVLGLAEHSNRNLLSFGCDYTRYYGRLKREEQSPLLHGILFGR